MIIEFEKDKKDEYGFIRGSVKGWAAETWSGDSNFPESYDFQIYSPRPNQVKVNLMVRTSVNYLRTIKDRERKDLKQAIADHYKDRFPDCTLTLHD